MRKVIKSLGLSLLVLSGVFCLFSCNNEIIPPVIEATPSVKGTISLPASSGLFPEDIWVKVVENETTKYVGRVNSDATFSVSGLDAAKKYDVMFTSIEPEQQNVSREFKSRAASTTNGFGGWLSDVSASIDDANIGSVKIKPLGTINGKAIRSGAVDNYDVMVYIPGTSFMAMTNEDGSFSIANVPQGTHRLRYTSDDYMSQMKEKVLLFSDDDTVNPVTTVSDVILIKNAGILKGYATLDGAASNAGIIIKLEGDNATGSEIGTTASDGSFSIPDVKPGIYSALFSYAGYIDRKVENLVIEAAKTTSLPSSVSLIANGGTITGSVTQNDGAAGTGASVLAKVTIGEADFTYSSTVDADGKFTLNDCRPADGYSITVSKTGFASVVRSGISLTVEGIILPEVMLSSEFGGLSGYVQDSEMNAINGAQINIGDYTAFTNSEGYFIKSELPLGQYTITVSKDGYTTKTLAQKVSIESNKAATIGEQMLTSMYGSINGTIALNDGKSPEGATVTAASTDGRNSYPATAASDGTYSISNVLPATYTLSVTKEGYEAGSKTISVTADYTTEAGTITLESLYGSLKVLVNYADKDPDDKITVSIRNGESSIRTATTSNSSTLIFDDIPVGAGYVVAASALGYSSSEKTSVSVLSNTETTVQLDDLSNRYGSMSGTVQDTRGNGISGVQVLMKAVPDNGSSYTATTDTDGSFSKTGIAIGNYEITISKDGYSDLRLAQSVSVESGRTAAIGTQWLTSIYGAIGGTARLQGSADHTGILVTATGARSYTASTGADGSYSLAGMEPGSYAFAFTKAGYVNQTANVTVEADKASLVPEAILISSSCAIAGSVVLEGSPSNSGVTVSATLVGDSSKVYTATTLEDGTYYIGGLDAGQYSIQIQMNGYVTDRSKLVHTTYGNTTVIDPVVLKSVRATVRGSVTLIGTNVHTGINVMLKTQDNRLQYDATTAQDGAFVLTGVQPGVYNLYVSKAGYESKAINDITIEPSSVKTIDSISLAVAERSIYGNVQLELRSDHAGALITATKTSDPDKVYSAISNSAGDYSLAGMEPGEYRIVITSAGYRTLTLPTTDVMASSTANLGTADLIVARGTISGLIKLEGWTDYSGIIVELVGTSEETTTTSSGYYSFHVPAGNYAGGVRFSKIDFETTSDTETITVLTDSTYAVPERTIKATHNTIRGTVDVDGTNDDSGVVVSIDGTSFSMVTLTDGKYRFDHVPLGDYSLRYQRENAPVVTADISVFPALEVIVPTTTLLPQQASIHGYVTLDGMTNYTGITVEVKNNDTLQVVTASSGADGYFYIPNILTSGAYTVSYSKQGWDTQSMNVTGLTPLENRSLTLGGPVVLLDTTPPQIGSFSINTGSNFTDNKNVSLNIPVIEQGSGTVSMQLRLNGNPASPNWLPYAIVVTKDLEEIFAPNYVGNGEYTISVRVKDLAGNVSGWMDDSITLTDQKTVVKGVLTDSQLHWTEEKSPYRVEGNILVEENKTLVIDPGVEVLFAGEYYILVDGNTWVNGTEQKMVRFLNDFDYSGMWEGLIISAKSPSLVFSDEELISGNYFNYAYFAQAQRALNAGAVNQQNGLYVENCNFSETNLNSITFDGFTGSHIVLKNNILKSDMRLSIHDDSTRILIENNEIQTNFVNLFITLYSYSSIENIIIENNSFDATQIEFSVGGWDARSVNRFRFVHNIIKDTQNPIIISTVNGFYPNSSTMNFSSNNFINCSGYLVNTAGRSYQSRSDNVLPFDFTNTFWGDAATEELLSPGFDGNASFIYDFYDDFTIPRVNNGEYRVNQ